LAVTLKKKRNKKMNSKIKAKYLLIYILLNTTGFLLAFRFWWTDSLILSGLNKFTLLLLFSIGICWTGILFLSVMLSRHLILKPDNFNFISPFDLLTNEYYSSEIGIDKAKKIKNTITFIAFPTLFLTIASFIFLMNIYEKNQLKKHGIIESVSVKEIHYDIKQNPYAFIKYQNEKHSTNLFADSLKVNDTVKIIYSKSNPKIIEYLDEYKKE
jgi:hypothetical protein